MTDVTIVIATAGQRPAMLEEAVRSVPPDVPAIVVDDGALGIGYVRARMAGLADVSTPYVAFLDDDDVLGPDWLSRSLARIEAGADVVAASYWETDAELRPLREVKLLPATLSRLLSGHCPVNDGALVRTELLRRATWHPERGTAAMFSLWLDLARASARFDVVPEACWYHRLHAGQMSAALPEDDPTWRAEAIAEARA